MTFQKFIASPDGKKYSLAEWARRFNITRGYITQLRDGIRKPSLALAYEIEQKTRGRVKMQDWVRDEAGGEAHDSGLRRETPAAV